MKNLYLSEEFARRIVPALQELVGIRTTEVLHSLETIFLEGPDLSKSIKEGIRQSVSGDFYSSFSLGEEFSLGQKKGGPSPRWTNSAFCPINILRRLLTTVISVALVSWHHWP